MIHEKPPSTLTYQWEAFSSIVREALPMLKAYWGESQLYSEELPLDPDFSSFFEMERLGRFRVFCVRRDGLLVGVNSFFVGSTLLRREPPTAAGFILVLSPAERKGWTGIHLVKKPEEAFLLWGVRLCVYTPSSKNTDMGPLLLRLGYKRAGGSYEKML